jgi:hypothetical protein
MPPSTRKRFRKGDVVTFSLPPGWLRGLPEEDQQEIRARIGKPVTVQSYRRGDGCVELFWWEYKRKKQMKSHSIWLKPASLRPVSRKSLKARATKRR